MEAFPYLTSLVLVPAVGALLVALVPRGRDDLVRLVGMAAAMAALLIAAAMLVEFDGGRSSFQMVSEHPWIAAWGISWKLGIDGISVFLVVLSTLLFPVAIIGPKVHRDYKGYVAWMLLLEA
ncbi:MAG: Fe-S-binding domain-containing protein, partial [Acidimicrobiia bacterium]|nr:Fe-S-binding domain-containing protein [Acidimicrobiia bacterium]